MNTSNCTKLYINPAITQFTSNLESMTKKQILRLILQYGRYTNCTVLAITWLAKKYGI